MLKISVDFHDIAIVNSSCSGSRGMLKTVRCRVPRREGVRCTSKLRLVNETRGPVVGFAAAGGRLYLPWRASPISKALAVSFVGCLARGDAFQNIYMYDERFYCCVWMVPIKVTTRVSHCPCTSNILYYHIAHNIYQSRFVWGGTKITRIQLAVRTHIMYT